MKKTTSYLQRVWMGAPIVMTALSLCVSAVRAQNLDEKPYSRGSESWKKVEGPFNENCSKCHQRLGERLAEQVKEWQSSIHYKYGIFCDSCHGGDPISTVLPVAMGEKNGFKPSPGPKDIPRFCGPECHQDAFATNEGNVHTEDFPENKWEPTCVYCHGSHEVQPVNLDLISLESKACKPCHDRQFYIRQTRRDELEASNNFANKLYAELENMPDENPMKSVIRVRLDKAHKELRKLAHYFNRKKIDAALESVDRELAYLKSIIEFDESRTR